MRTHKLTMFLAFFCLVALDAQGEACAQSRTTDGGDIPDIPYTEFTLANGLRVIVHEDHKAPIAAVTIWYHVGSKNEVRGKTGFAHLFEHLMFNGSEHYNDEYFKPFDEVGATSMNGTTDFDRTNYFETVPNTAIDLALWMESDRMGHLLGAIDQAKLDEQRGVVENEKRQNENQPYGKVFGEIMANVFPSDHPYSWLPIGSMEDLNAATLDDVRQWFKTYYGPNNATLVIAGDVDVDTMKQKVELYFGDIPPGPPLKRQTAWIAKPAAGHREVLQDRVPQARIYKVWAAPEWRSADSEKLSLLDGVLTGGKNSRLYKRLVYDDQVATDVGSFSIDGEIAGVFGLYASVQAGHSVAEVESRIDEELERVREAGPTNAELARVKTDTLASFVRGIERVGGFNGKSNILAENAVFGGRPDYYKTALAELEAAGPNEVREAARRWLGGPAYTLEVRPFDQALAASGQSVDRSTPPMPKSFPTANFPPMEKLTLPNGLRLIVAERHAVPVVRMSLQFDAGYAADSLAKPGTANLAMAMLDEGTAKRSALEIDERLSELGANLSAGSNLDVSFVSLSALKEHLDDSLAIFGDVILNPSFPSAELERLRKLELSDIEQEKARPMSMALRVMPQYLYGAGHAYALPMTGSGTEESVTSMRRDDLIAFHDTWFKPNNATLIVAGDTTLAEIAPKVTALFAKWQRGTVPTKNIPEVAPAPPRVLLIDRPGSSQSIVLAGELVPPRNERDEVALDTMNSILGGAFTSRINMNLREDKTWSYGTRSLIVDTQKQRPLITYAAVQGDKTAPSMVEIAREFNDFVGSRPPTDEEVATAKKRSVLTLPGRWETARAVAGDIAEIVRFGLPEDYWQQYPQLIESVTTAQVEQIAQLVLKPSELVWVVVGDLDTIEAPVRSLDLGPVQIIDVDGHVRE